MTGDAPGAVGHEVLRLWPSDLCRFLSATTGQAVHDPEAFPLTAAFAPFAHPVWAIGGAADHPDDGGSLDALPGLDHRSGAVMGLGQEIEVAAPPPNGAVLERRSQLTGDEPKTGSTGSFRLLTVRREVVADGRPIATQLERFAVRDRP